MGLLVLVFFFLIISFLQVITMIRKKEPYSKALFKVALAESLGMFFLLISLLVLYHNIPHTNKIMSKIFLICSVAVSFFMFDFTVQMPRFEEKKRIAFTCFNALLHLAGVISILFLVYDFSWNNLSGFKFYSYTIIGIPASKLIAAFFILFTPFIFVIITIIKLITEKSKIYRQQLIFYLLSIFMMFAASFVIFSIMQLFSWMIAIMPAGYILFIYLTGSAFASTVIYDKKQVAFSVLRFTLFILIFAVAAGFFSSIVLLQVRSIVVQIVLLIFIAFSFLLARNFLSINLRSFLGDTGEYAERVEKDLRRISYTEGRESVLDEFLRVMKRNIKLDDLSVFITDDGGVLQPVYSPIEITDTFLTDSSVLRFMFNNNISVVMRSQVLAGFEFTEVREEIISFMDKTFSEVLIFIREGQNFIGIIGLGAKRKKEAYTGYDFEVLSNLYSYFFLVIYYLRNIAKQDIVLTVDREIEMSDQIIDSLQKTMDTIENKSIEIDSVSFSAHRLGGDFIDFIRLSESRYFFLIGDIAGKGLSASMSMLILKSVLHTYLPETKDFKELIEKLNIFIKENLPKGTFFAGLFGIIDFNNSLIYYINCGIPLMAMYIDSYKNVVEIQGEGRVLGFVKNIKPFLKVRKIVMNKDDTIVFTTDGLLESENLRSDRFSNERVKRILFANKEKSAKEIASLLYKSLVDFVSHKITDDVTILVFKK